MKPLYVKSNRMRAPHFQTEVMIYEMEDSRRFVRKRALSPTAAGHIQNIIEFTKQIDSSRRSNDIYVLNPVQSADSSIKYPFINGQAWTTKLIQVYRDFGYQALVNEIKVCQQRINHVFANLEAKYYSSAEFKKVFETTLTLENEYCQENSNIDMIFTNFLEGYDGNSYLIDCEWVFPFSIPTSFNLFRSLNVFWSKYKHELININLDSLIMEFGISNETLEKYKYMETKFQEYVHQKDTTLSAYLKPRVSTVQLFNKWKEESFYAKAFLPLNGAYYAVMDDFVYESLGSYQACFDFKVPFEDHIRLDLVPFPCIYEIQRVILTTKCGSLISDEEHSFSNVSYCENTISLNKEKNLLLVAVTNNTHLFISYPQMSAEEVKVNVDFKVHHGISESFIQSFIELSAIQEKYERLEKNYIQLSDIQEKYELSEKRTSELNRLFEQKLNELNEYKHKLDNSEERINILEDHNRKYIQELEYIKKTKIWKFYSKFKKSLIKE